jgi:hypothetical protein
MIAMTSGGVPMDLVSLNLDESGRGRLTVRVSDRPMLMAVVAHLDGGGVLGGIAGGARFLVLDGEVSMPSTYPAEVTLPVIEREMPDYAPRFRMSFGSNFLQSGCWVNVIQFEPPAEDGSAEGLLRVHCETLEEYRELRRFTDEPHGSALKSVEGSMWFVQRVADDGQQARSFPQVVTFRLRWHYSE